jgi:predicted DsbA family dithiol-disulfide isomerase
MHKGAEPAARAVQAAKRQGKEWAMAELLFANPRKTSVDDLVGHASQLGLDVDKFRADLESEEVKKEVASDVEAGKAAGVRGTPTIFVNGIRYQGERSLQAMKPVIDEQIKKADELLGKGTPLDKVYQTLASSQ